MDSSGLRPWLFSSGGQDISSSILDAFLSDLEIDFYLSKKAEHEFSTASLIFQPSLFEQPFDHSLNKQAEAIYISNSGYLSTTGSIGIGFSFITSKDIQNQPTLWETSKEWSSLSPEDRSVLQLAKDLKATHSSVAILTNDWSLRQQSIQYEGIEARGTCSMLAGLVLGRYITFQKGTYIFSQWLAKEPRWIPTHYLERRKFTFAEILKKEKELQIKNRSLWLH